MAHPAMLGYDDRQMTLDRARSFLSAREFVMWQNGPARMRGGPTELQFMGIVAQHARLRFTEGDPSPAKLTPGPKAVSNAAGAAASASPAASQTGTAPPSTTLDPLTRIFTLFRLPGTTGRSTRLPTPLQLQTPRML